MKTSNTPFPLSALMSAQKNDDYISTIERSVFRHDVFLDTDIGDPSNYRDLLALLFNANEDDTVVLYINSHGGQLDTALAIVEGLKATKAHVVAVIIGACHSAASIISMYCHEVAVLDNAYSMVHTASFGASGNTSNVKAHTEFTIRQVEKLLNDTYEGFLSKEELANIKTGVEMWFDAEEIKKRMNSRVKFLNTKFKAKPKKEPSPVVVKTSV